MKTEKENITEFLACTGYNDIIGNITDEHSDTCFYSDASLTVFLSNLRQLNDKDTTFSILSFKDVFNVFKKHNFEIENNSFFKKELLNYISFVDDNIEMFHTILVELKEVETNFRKLILFFNRINAENKDVLKDLL